MDYTFIRKLGKGVSAQDAKTIWSALAEQGIETFVKSESGYENMTADTTCETSELFVSAADIAFARKVLTEIGFETYLCSEAEANAASEKSEVEKAEEEFYKKHKQNQIFAIVIIAGVIIFMIMQFFAK